MLKIPLPTFVELGMYKIENLHDILRFHNVRFKKALVLGDRRTFSIGGNKIIADFKKQGIKTVKHIVQNSDEPNVTKTTYILRKKNPDIVIGFGGGKVLDVGKLAAGLTKTKFIGIPTTLSHDGIASPVAVIKDKNNIPVSRITKAPYGVIVDISVIKRAPARLIKAGVGDLISNLSAVFDARLAQKIKGETIDDTALTLAEAGPRNLLQFRHPSIRNDEFLLNLARGLIKSGFAMCIIGSSRPASGSEHKISHSIDHRYAPRKTLHGEQVGIATLFTMVMQKNKYLNEVKRLYKNISFPQHLKYLSLTTEEFITVVHKAHTFRPRRYTIIEHKKLSPGSIKKIVRKAHLSK